MLPPIHCSVLIVVVVCHIKSCSLFTDVWYQTMKLRKRQMLCLARPCPVLIAWTDEKAAILLVDGQVTLQVSIYVLCFMGKVSGRG